MPNSQGYTVSQSAWAMDAIEDFQTSGIFVSNQAANTASFGAFQSGSAGELQNDYSQCYFVDKFANEYALSCSQEGADAYPADTEVIF